MAGSIKFHYSGFNQLRSEPAIQAELHRRGEAIAEAAGGGDDFKVIDSPGRTRARVIIVTATPKAMRAEATDRTLSQALDAGRG